MHTDSTLDPIFYLKPQKIYAGNSYTTVSNKYFKEIHHYLKKINLRTDKGWFLSDNYFDYYLQMDYIKEMTDFRQTDYFLSYSIKLSSKEESYRRTYQKMQHLFAEAGGFIKMISVLSFYISYFYNKSKFYEFLGNQLICEKEFVSSRINITNNNKNINFDIIKNYFNAERNNNQNIRYDNSISNEINLLNYILTFNPKYFG